MNALNQQVSEGLNGRRSELAAQLVARVFVRHPELEQHPAVRRSRWLGAKVILAARGVPATDLADMLGNHEGSLQQALPPEFSGLARDYLDIGLLQLPRFPDNLPSFITEGAPLETLARQYLEALLRGERVLPPSLSSTWLGGNARVRPLSGCVPAQSADVSAKQQFAAHVPLTE